MKQFEREWPRQCGNPAKFAKPSCNRCFGRGVEGRQIAVGLPSSGKYLMCSCAEKRYATARKTEEAAMYAKINAEEKAAEVAAGVVAE